MKATTFKTVVGGELVELPGTIAGIRDNLPAEEAALFSREIEHLAAADLPAALARWALAGTGADDEDQALFDLLAAGAPVDAVEVRPYPAAGTGEVA